MKKIVFLSLNLLWTTFVLAQVVNIPDANFKKALVSNAAINTNKDAEIQVNEAVVFSQGIYVFSQGINDLTGIEAFVNLTKLDCGYNTLTVLDLSKNVALTSIKCDFNQLITLNVNNCVVLTHLFCDNNKLSSLNVNNNLALTTLNCSENTISDLDVSKNILLEVLNCSFNTISTLDISKNIALRNLYCEDNKLSMLDVSKNIVLKVLHCYTNGLTSLDVSKNTSLSILHCSRNLLSYLNVKNGANKMLEVFDANTNFLLYCIEVDDPNAKYTNWSKDDIASYSTNCIIPTKDISSEGFLQLYPNPSTDSFAFSDLTEAPLSVAIYDLHGKLVQHYPSPASNYDISTLCNGLYIVKAQFDTGEAIAKLLKGE
jgi:hypothetical protein